MFAKVYPPLVQGWKEILSAGVIPVDTMSTLILPANISRTFLAIMNNSNRLAYLNFGATAEYGKFIRLNAGSQMSFSGSELFLGDVYAISTGPILIDIIEGG